jgi:hypothetical protein
MTTPASFEDQIRVSLRRDVLPMTDRVMEALDTYPGVVGPMVVGDMETKTLFISFDFEAADASPDGDQPSAGEIVTAALAAARIRRENQGEDPPAEDITLDVPRAG